jgi:hypothetical protein
LFLTSGVGTGAVAPTTGNIGGIFLVLMEEMELMVLMMVPPNIVVVVALVQEM